MKIVKWAAILFIALLVTAGMLITFSGLHPLSWKPGKTPSFTGTLSLNEKLLSSQIISLHGWYGPEDIVFDSAGYMYCGAHRSETDFSDGRILRIDSTGKSEIFYNSASWVAGLHFDQNGNLIALSHREGLISISPDKKVTVLAATDNSGKRFLIPNGLDIASDGKIYFSNTSEKERYTIKYGKKIVMEMRPAGGLYSYDPQTKKLTTLISGTYFGNGVVLSRDETHLLMVETSRYRILRYWLSGKKKGTIDTFIGNLPGFPNGISIRKDGSYWLGFSTKRNKDLDAIHSNKLMKKLVYALPGFLQPKPDKFGMVLHISPNGQILSALYDTKGKIMPEAGAVKEYKGYLYMGGDVLPHIGKYKLEDQ